MEGRRGMKILVAFFLLAPLVSGEEFGQFIPGTAPDYLGQEDNKDKENAHEDFSAHIPDSFDGLMEELEVKDDQFDFLSEKKEIDTNLTASEEVNDVGGSIPFKGETKAELEKYNVQQTLDRIYDKGDRGWSFLYFRDAYVVSSNNNTFERTFESTNDQVDSYRVGSFHLVNNGYWYKGGVSIGYQLGLAVGHAQGKGSFNSTFNTSVSNTTFQLWSFPLYAGLFTDLFRGKRMKISLSGGPAALALYQTRSDREKGEYRKTREQIGFGGYGHAQAKFALSQFFPSWAFGMFNTYSVTSSFFSINLRYETYGNFQEPGLSMSGISLGAGLDFEYN